MLDIPNKQSVEVKVRPLLSLPPVMLFAVGLVTLHSIGGASLGNGVEENSAPSDVDVVLPQEGREFELEKKTKNKSVRAHV